MVSRSLGTTPRANKRKITKGKNKLPGFSNLAWVGNHLLRPTLPLCG
jgi:hypothetical protein